MRVSQSNGGLHVLAISGTYVVMLGFDLPASDCEGLLGFSIHRADHTENTSKYLEGMKCFEATDPGFPSGAEYPSDQHPFQSFQWADYSAKPGYSYTYTITALKGTPAALTKFRSVSLPVSTEKPDATQHDVYFNRGNAASQEYVRRFGDRSPEEVPNNAAFTWLSRGLYEAMVAFIRSCQPGVHALRIAAYEFHYEGILQLIKEVWDEGNGVDIQIVYDARKDSPKKMNEQRISELGIGDICKGRTEGKSYISHNKFMVKLENDVPVSVWTGGTNFSDGGIFGHSNVAHVVQDSDVAALYLSYWEELHADHTVATTKKAVEVLTTVPAAPPPTGVSVLFSPRKTLDALNYYGQLALSAKEGLFMTFAFGLNGVFKNVYENAVAPLRFALLEKATRPLADDDPQKAIEEQAIQSLRNKPENVFAIGDFIRTNKFDGWVKEQLSGLNSNVKYIHNKFMLVDPLSDDPIVIVGSANFSDASTTDNDENMLIVRGNTRVADIYLGEFMRLFSHFSFRESLKWRKPDEPPKPLRTDDWWSDSFGDTPRSARRKYFAPQ